MTIPRTAKAFSPFIIFFFIKCTSLGNSIGVIDTDFSKGRLVHKQNVSLSDLVKFHGHLCDGLVIGFLALKFSYLDIFPDEVVDRTNLRIVSRPGPCLTDAAIFLTGGRYQYNTFYVSSDISYIYILQRIDTGDAWGVKMKPGVFPKNIAIASNLAIEGKLNSCELNELKKWEDDFSLNLLNSKLEDIFILEKIKDYNWKPILKGNFTKTDILNKNKEACDK